MRTIGLNQSVYSLCSAYPEFIKIMEEIGFTDITKPGMLNTAGRFMTIPKGAALKGIDLDIIKQKLAEKGFKAV